MQRKATPQSLSHKHCAVIGAASLHTPFEQDWPSAQSAVEPQVAWHWPPLHTRPCPQAVSFEQRTTVEVPQVEPV
jgi:hypothetical protein